MIGARKEYVWKVAAVESVEMFARASGGRFLACTMFNPSYAGMAVIGDPALKDMGALSLGGPYWKGKVNTVDLVG